MALRNQLKLLRRLSLKYSLKLCCKIIRHPFKNSYHRSVFIHCSQFYINTAFHGRHLILLGTHVVLVRMACGSNILDVYIDACDYVYLILFFVVSQHRPAIYRFTAGRQSRYKSLPYEACACVRSTAFGFQCSDRRLHMADILLHFIAYYHGWICVCMSCLSRREPHNRIARLPSVE